MHYLLWFISVQLIYETIPVSSSGHIALAVCLWCLNYRVKCQQVSLVLQTPEVALWMTVPTIFIIPLFFVKQWWFLLVHISRTWRIVSRLIGYMLCSNSITFGFYLFINYYSISIPLWFGFFITTFLLLALRFCPEKRSILTVDRAVLLGVVQGVALLPGISRFAAVFTASRYIGISNRRSFQISWMLQWPLGVGMALLSGYRYAQHFTHWVPVTIMTFTHVVLASVVSLGALYGVYWMVRYKKMWYFAVYMIFPLILSWFYCG